MTLWLLFNYGPLRSSVKKKKRKTRFSSYTCRVQTPCEQMLPESEGKMRQNLIGTLLELGHDKFVVYVPFMRAVFDGGTRTPLKTTQTNVAASMQTERVANQKRQSLG